MAKDGTGGLHYTPDHLGEVQTEALADTNPHHQRVGPRWVRGGLVYALPCGVIHIDPSKQKWAKEYVVCYSLDGNDGKPERVPGQYGIYDSRPGDEHYHPVGRYHYVIVPRDYEPNSLRSEEDVLGSGYRAVQADMYTL